MDKNAPLTALKGLGPKTAQDLARLSIADLESLVLHFPISYRDLREVKPLCDACYHEQALFRLTVKSQPYWLCRRPQSIFTLVAGDETATVRLTFFNQPYCANRLVKQGTFLFFGTLKEYNGMPAMDNPKVYDLGENLGIEPVYTLCGKLKQKAFRSFVKQALPMLEIVEPFSHAFLHKNRLLSLREELSVLHFPKDMEDLALAYRSHQFKKLLVTAAMLSRTSGAAAPRLRPVEGCIARYQSHLPFSLTGAQMRAMQDMLADLAHTKPMNRLLQGDVGSGKTAAAFFGAFAAKECGYQTLMMAPTELLAVQHYNNARKIFDDAALITGSTPLAERNRILTALSEKKCSLLIGTHALLYLNIPQNKIAFLITDEQHRFGVAQRAALCGIREGVHMLVMSATPIPRTLALALYGNAGVSIIDELPSGRKPVITRIVSEKKRADMYAWIADQVRSGRQAYVVCPLIEPSDEIEARSAFTVFAELKKALPGVSIALLNGRMRAEQKNDVMSAFQGKKTQILVSTTVIEVGVDVPNATIMVIENAERFGLATLHQLRGRVGRGSHQSYCWLVTPNPQNKRLVVMREVSDGMKIAELDLKERGAGELIGLRQHGADASLSVQDLSLFSEAKQCYETLSAFPADHAFVQAEAAKLLSGGKGIVLN